MWRLSSRRSGRRRSAAWWSSGRSTCARSKLKPLAEARQEIQAGAKEGVAGAQKPARERGARTTCRCSSAISRSRKSPQRSARFELVAPDTVAFTRDTMPEAYRLIRVLYRFINPD